MSKRKDIPNEADTAERDTSDSKRPRMTDTPAPSQTVVQSNSLFFNRLNRDIRNIIYSYLTLPPIRNQSTTNTAGLVLSCRQAHQEATTEGHFQAWLLIQRLLRAYASAFHSEILLPASLRTAHDLARLRKLTLVSEADMDFESLKYLEPLGFLELDELRVHYTGITGPPIEQCMDRARTILWSACAKADSKSGSTSNGP
jgi:hypothetical protein